jgi:glycosyltransferase involved in cell wall biosynthesis
MTQKLRRLAVQLKQPRMLVAAEEMLGRELPFANLLGAADLAMITSPKFVPALPVAMCMARGLPIIGGDTPALREFLRHGSMGWLVPRLAPRLLAKATIELFEDPRRAAALGQAARAEAIRRFDPQRMARSFASLYRRTAGVSSKGAAAELAGIEANRFTEQETLAR